jgi:hypothetical protein
MFWVVGFEGFKGLRVLEWVFGVWGLGLGGSDLVPLGEELRHKAGADKAGGA